MADRNSNHQDTQNTESWENLSCEWTIIGDNCSYTDDDNSGADNINEDQEPSRSMEAVRTLRHDTLDCETDVTILEKHDEDSDGISVITESEAEQLIINKRLCEHNDCKNQVLGALKIYENTGERTAPQVGTLLNVVIACSLAAIIGLGAGRILGMDDKCHVTNAVDFSTIKIESDNLINQIKELIEVKDVLDEIKATIPQVKRAQEKMLQRESKPSSKLSERRKKASKISDAYIFDSDTTILEQLQTSLSTLYSVINGINPENDFIKSDASRTESIVADLVEFRNIIHTVIKELEDTGRPKEMEFLRHAEKKIRDVCESLLNDLSYTVHGLTIKIHHKLNKVRRKLNKKLCLLKNSESLDEKISKSLEVNNLFLESCDKILDVTLKSRSKVLKNNENEEPNKKKNPKIRNNLKRRSLEKSASESEDNSYPTDSSSESFIPELIYNLDNKLWKKKQKLQQGRKETKQKSGNKLLKNDSKHRKIRNVEAIKSSGGQSFKKLMMEVLVPADSCPLNQKHWLKTESAYPEYRRLESPISNEKKPLYSTILKSVNITSSVKNNFNDEKLSGNEVPGNKFRAEVAKKNNEDLTETKHDFAPAESEMNVHTMKNMKEQWNTNIRQPIVEYSRDEKPVWSDGISMEKNEDPQQLEGSVKIPASAGPLKHCRNSKMCSSDDSVPSTESHKKLAFTTSVANQNKHKKGSKKNTMNHKPATIRNDDRKKPKAAKPERKTTGSLKAEKEFKKRKDNRLGGDWQLQRSRAREMRRDREHRSEWFFDRADSRQDARKSMDDIRDTKFEAGRFSHYSPCKSDRRDKCKPVFEERIHDEEESYDHWNQAKVTNGQKHLRSRAGFTIKKPIKMPHRKNIMQSKRR